MVESRPDSNESEGERPKDAAEANRLASRYIEGTLAYFEAAVNQEEMVQPYLMKTAVTAYGSAACMMFPDEGKLTNPLIKVNVSSHFRGDLGHRPDVVLTQSGVHAPHYQTVEDITPHFVGEKGSSPDTIGREFTWQPNTPVTVQRGNGLPDPNILPEELEALRLLCREVPEQLTGGDIDTIRHDFA